ncbi:hypothetical protein PV10_04321 [Exophiala mesophila]|uniref:Uncharacterized protein n=1 Tax=Exophiala mesophila TaxID=212818 RepID=A0A0D1ZEF8_EXOME|nr:uncharacterized protein PV10_04321 [Exophiala mesophila]KIV93077.1 hypothetical protein PV10_04321 [Exophiala mesophila]
MRTITTITTTMPHGDRNPATTTATAHLLFSPLTSGALRNANSPSPCRREEELEREEVERQLREVELQERMEMEREEQERQARLAETGEPEGGRDLDADIPDMDDDGGFDDQGDEEVEDEGEMEGMEEGDLDDDIPEADDQDLDLDDDGDETGDEDEDVMSPDPESGNGAWVYDSRREPDTDEETAELNPSLPGAVRTTGGGGSPHHGRRSGHFRHGTAIVAGVRVPVPGSEYDYDEREAEDLANAMLDEDEIFDQDEEMDDDGERDLDDDVPEPESEQGWEHTDTELDESEMDISILPNQLQRESLGGMSGTSERMSGGLTSGRPHGRSSGPWISERSPHVPSDSQISAQTRQPGPSSSFLQPGPPPRATRVISGNRHQAYIATPETFDSPATIDSSSQHRSYHQDVNQDSPDPFTSTGVAVNPRYANFRAVRANAATAASAANHRLEMENATASNPNSNPGSSSRTGAARAWLDGAAAAVGGSARRTLFGRAARRGGIGNEGTGGSGSGSGNGGTTNPAIASNSSGGLFTPELSHIGNSAGEMGNDGWGDTPIGQGRGNGSIEGVHPTHRRVQSQNTSRRSGRFLTSRRRGEVDGQT